MRKHADVMDRNNEHLWTNYDNLGRWMSGNDYEKNLPVDIWFRPCTRSRAFSQSLADSILYLAEIKLDSDFEFCWLCWSAFLVTCADCCRPPKTLSEWLQTRRVHHPNWSGIVLALPIASTCLSAPSPVETLPRFSSYPETYFSGLEGVEVFWGFEILK